MAALFPLFVRLKARKCLVIGAGPIAEGKLAGFLPTGADVWVIAPRATPKIQAWARAGKIRWFRRAFRDSDLNGCFCVVAATCSSQLHQRIFRLAQKQKVLCNVVDVPPLCDFYYPAMVRRGSLQIAISTGGRSPALAQRLRKKLEKQFGPEYAEWMILLGRARSELNASSEDAKEKRLKLHSLASEASFRAFRKQLHEKQNGRRQDKSGE